MHQWRRIVEIGNCMCSLWVLCYHTYHSNGNWLGVTLERAQMIWELRSTASASSNSFWVQVYTKCADCRRQNKSGPNLMARKHLKIQGKLMCGLTRIIHYTTIKPQLACWNKSMISRLFLHTLSPSDSRNEVDISFSVPLLLCWVFFLLFYSAFLMRSLIEELTFFRQLLC